MRIQDMFERDITRNINGVIKVGQDDDANVEQELSEYVITKELYHHFSTFFNAYEPALDAPTDKMGVWISGFFGSGKSHFLKMLSYLLSNKKANGKAAIDYLAPQMSSYDPLLESKARRCAGVPTEAILFNIDSKAPTTKDDTVIARTFARVFYENMGFYGADLKLARLECYVEGKGKTEAFRKEYEDLTGASWVKDRESYEFNADEMAEALANAGVMSEETALAWVNGDETREFSIDQLVDEVNRYCERRAQENGGQFRLLFMVDEIGQYIGDNTSLMLNLQTLVEDLGSKCHGRVWVMVTSQEAIDEVTTVVGNDFSKIQGRFDTRLSLSSSCADEVIKRRILAKTPDAADLLKTQYRAKSAVINNLYTFKDAQADLVGYKNSEDGYAAAFPFADYQFTLLQEVMEELRKQGSSGKHTSNGERSMLSGFQETAQYIKDKDQNALAPFWMFYDTLQNFLEGYHRAVIVRAGNAAEAGQGLEAYDVDVLKLLFLIRWVDREIPGNLENITTLMTDSIDCNRAQLRSKVQESLDRLCRQNYVSKNGETYLFLTDEEQEINGQIKRMNVDPGRMTQKVAELVFKDVLGTDKLTVDKNQFYIDQILDQTPLTSHDGLVLRVIAGVDGSVEATEQYCASKSLAGEAVVLLSDEYDFYGQLREAVQIDMYTRTLQIANMPQTQQDIVRAKQTQRTQLEKRAKELLEDAIVHGSFWSQGATFTPATTTSAKKILEDCVREQVRAVYTKLDYIDRTYDTDEQIKRILSGASCTAGTQQPNLRAAEEVKRQLDLDLGRHMSVTMADAQRKFQGKPYGWREIDVAAVMADLMATHKIKVTVSGKTLEPKDPACIDYLRRATKTKLATIELRRTTSPEVRAQAQRVLADVLGNRALPQDEETLTSVAREQLENKKSALKELIDREYNRTRYPGKQITEAFFAAISNVLAAGSDPADFLSRVVSQKDSLLDGAEDFEDVEEFFDGPQRELFDNTIDYAKTMSGERDYLSPAAAHSLDEIERILSSENPFREINRLGELKNAIVGEYKEKLQNKRRSILDTIATCFERIDAHAKEKDSSLSIVGQKRAQLENEAHAAKTLTKLDAMPQRISTAEGTLCDKIDQDYEQRHRRRPANANVTLTSHDPKHSADATPAPEPPKERIDTVSKTALMPSRTLRSAEDADAYLAGIRAEILRRLNTCDGVRIY